MIKSRMTIKMVNENLAVLQRNGEDMVCPFVPPIQLRQKVQNAFGQIGEQISIQKSPCNSNCPLFEINPTSVSITCSGKSVDYTIEEVYEYNTPKEDLGGTIVNLGGNGSDN
jgi:hypothetical protein